MGVRGKPLRYIYIDEAGTSAKEPVTVVAGVIVDADTQYVAAEQKVASLLETVPAQHRNAAFPPHAKAIFQARRICEWDGIGRIVGPS